MKKVHIIFTLNLAVLLILNSCDKNKIDDSVSIPSQFMVAYRTPDDSGASSFLQTKDDGYLITGSHGEIIKTDKNGKIEWTKKYHGFLSKIINTTDGGYILSGYKFESGWSAVLVIKLDENFNLEWAKKVGGEKDANGDGDKGANIIQTSDGGYAVIGETSSFPYGGSSVDNYIIKLDKSGSLMWTRTLGEAEDDRGGSIACGNDGSIYISGYISKSQTLNTVNTCLAKFSLNGDLIWTKILITGSSNFCNSIVCTVEGDIILTGSSGNYLQPTDTYIANFSGAGELKWFKLIDLGLDKNSQGLSICKTNDGKYLIAGTRYTNKGGANINNEVSLIKIDRDGNIDWCKIISDSTNDIRASEIVSTKDGGYAMGGFITDFAQRTQLESNRVYYNWDLLLMKMDNNYNTCGLTEMITPHVSDYIEIISGGYIGTGGSIKDGVDELSVSITSEEICIK